jgi:hypothetical protein
VINKNFGGKIGCGQTDRTLSDKSDGTDKSDLAVFLMVKL